MGQPEDPGELTSFERAAQLYRALGDKRGEAESLFWVGCFHQVVRRDNDAAIPALDQSFELASEVGDKQTMSEALRHLGIAAHETGRHSRPHLVADDYAADHATLPCGRALPLASSLNARRTPLSNAPGGSAHLKSVNWVASLVTLLRSAG
jgi:hypothetical protein